MWKRLLLSCVIFWVIFAAGLPARAQDETPEPIYVVQSGDTLWDIARRFGVSVDDLVQANNITDASLLKAGDQLTIPGLSGISGRLQTRPLAFGETLSSLSRTYALPEETLARLNRLTSPAELYVGLQLILPYDAVTEDPSVQPDTQRMEVSSGQTLLELAVLQGSEPWQIALANGVAQPAQVIPGDVLHIRAANVQPGEPAASALLPQIASAVVNPSILTQGKTFVVKLQAPQDLIIKGSFLDHPLNFFYQEGTWFALQGVHAMAEPGVYPIDLSFTPSGGEERSFSQNVRLDAGDYIFDPDLLVDPATIDPQVTQPENEQWNALAAPVTGQKLWQGTFISPVDRDFSDCWPSRFGNRRSYNDSGYLYFHTGLDFCGAVGNSIYAPAAGVVVFAGPLSVRGNATMIDHGWGVYTAYMHQSEILVAPGDRVEAGQLIGKVGNTGRVTGPHLHWEVWVGGNQVDPLEWLQSSFP